ncbi:MAG: hypothetical protein ACLP7A_04655 [Desulfobaccales bacterium]
MNLIDRLIVQLDTLIPFISISYKDVFDLIQKEKDIWFQENSKGTLPKTYEIFRTQVTHSAFLLGYSYFEVFLGELIRKIYLSNHKMLPKEKQLKFSEIIEASTYEDVIEMMIEKETLSIFYQSFEKIVEYYQTKLELTWPVEHKNQVLVASLLRNCIIHNMSRVDIRLARNSEYEIGQEIQLSSSEVHSYGIHVRALSRELYRQANERYFNKNKGA